MNTQIKSVIPSAITSDKKEKTVSNLRNEIFRRYLRVVHILFAVLILIQFMPISCLQMYTLLMLYGLQ